MLLEASPALTILPAAMIMGLAVAPLIWGVSMAPPTPDPGTDPEPSELEILNSQRFRALHLETYTFILRAYLEL